MENSEDKQYTDKDIDKAITKLRFDNNSSNFKILVSKGFDINNKHVIQIVELTDLNIEAIEELVDLGFNINVKKSMKTPLFFSLIENDLSLDNVKRVTSLKGINLNATDYFGTTILFKLSLMCENYIEDVLEEDVTLDKKDEMILSLLKVFIDNGADYKTYTKSGSLIDKYREFPKVLKYLFSLDIDLEYRARSGMTAFLSFCYYQHEVDNPVEFTKFWLTSGVDIYALNSLEESDLYGFNALMCSIKGKNIDTVKVLLEKDFDINYTAPKGETAFTVALDSMNSELIELIQDRIEDPYSDPKIVEKMVKLKVREQNWEEVISWGNKISENEMSSGATLNYLSSAYQKTGNMEKSLSSIKRAIELFGLDNTMLDGLVLALVHSGKFQELVNFWYDNKKEFKADEGEASNIIANLIVAFDQACKSAEAISEFAPLVDIAEGTSESKRGLINFNLACMYAKHGDVIKAVEQIHKALEGEFVVRELSDPDFDNIRDCDLFKLLITQENEGIYYYFEINGESRTIYTRYDDEYDSISYVNKKYKTTKREFKSKLEMNKAIITEKSELLEKGFIKSAPDFISIWLPIFDEIFRNMAKADLKPLTEFRMEWDFSFDEECNSLERPYYCYSKEGYDNDGYEILYIPQKKYHDMVMDEVIKLDSFKNLNKSEEVKLIQSEHDSGDEFEYIWRQN